MNAEGYDPEMETVSGGQPPLPGITRSLDVDPTIGPYELLRKLGQGGMGVVWLAQQHHPVERLVALKLVNANIDSASVLARFSVERQALALMQHPSIARVYDAGTTPGGRPYFVMEYIDGVPITEYCDARHLTIAQRLELFVMICDGIQHAHQKAILHRDLKPSNVLVAEQDGKPAVKIIDFGLAKAIGSTPSEIPQMTKAGEVLGTPRYMSPEQLDFSEGGIDTRTDVYSLGVLLYELLTGMTPYSETRAFDELTLKIRHGDVGFPSARFGRTTEGSTKAAANCGAAPEAVRKQLEVDLDWIVVKALATDREQRYSSASEFAADILRHLRDEPVQARRPRTSYRVAKFVKRNRLAVLLASLAAILVMALAVTMTVQAIRIARERDRANQEAETTKSIVQFLTRMFVVNNPSEGRGNSVTAREILDRSAQAISTNLKQSPEVRGQLMYTMGEAYLGLGLYSKAQTLLENAIAVQSQILGKENPVTLRSMARLGYTLRAQEHFSAAAEVLRNTLDTQARVLKPDSQDVLATRDLLAEALSSLGKYAETETLLRETIRLQSRVFGPDAGQTLRSQRSLSVALLRERKYQEAEQQSATTLQAHRRVLGPDHPGTLYEADAYGQSLSKLGRFDESEKVLRETLAIEKRVLGATHPNTRATQSNLAWALQGVGRPREAIAIYRDLLEHNPLGPDSPSAANIQNDLAIVLSADKQFEEAETMFRLSLATRRRLLPAGHRYIVDSLCSIGTSLGYLGRYAEAEQEFRNAVQEAQRSEGSGALAEAYFHYAAGAVVSGHQDQALDLLDRAVNLGLDPITYSLSKEKDLNPLHGAPGFEALVARMQSQLAVPAK